VGQTAEQVRLDLTLLLKQEGAVWTALCLELDIASCGATEAEALESLQGLVELYLDDCLSQGEYPIPLRPVPCEALQEFLSPGQTPELSITSRRASFPIHAQA
jgi:predicted RNase H-like HicB family nuclease